MKPGDRYGMLEVLYTLTGEEAGRPYDGQWSMCRCDCGSRRLVRSRHLTYRKKQNVNHYGMSCGCKRSEWSGQAGKAFGGTRGKNRRSA